MTSITFLGTGGDIFVTSKGHRNAAGIIIKHEDMQFHIDPGPNSLSALAGAGINVRETTAIICTSPKVSQANDVNALVSAMTYNGLDIKGVVVGTKTVVEGNEDTVPFLQPFFAKQVERVITVEAEKKIGIEQADIYFTEATDYTDTVGFILQMPDVVIGYSSDTSYSERIAKQYQKCDILILNVQNPRNKKLKHTMSTEDAIKFAKKINPSLLVITRFGKDMLDADPLIEAREIHRETHIQVLAAQEGQIIAPSSYSAQGKQKQLKGF